MRRVWLGLKSIEKGVLLGCRPRYVARIICLAKGCAHDRSEKPARRTRSKAFTGRANRSQADTDRPTEDAEYNSHTMGTFQSQRVGSRGCMQAIVCPVRRSRWFSTICAPGGRGWSPVDATPMSVLDGMSQTATLNSGFASDGAVRAYFEGARRTARPHAR